MPEIYADWKSLKPLNAPVPVGTKCVVIKVVEGDKLAIGEIVTTINFQRVPNCKNSDGIVDFFGIDRLALLPADYQAEPKAKGPYYERLKEITEIAHCGGLLGMSESDALIAIRKLTLETFAEIKDPRIKLPPIPQD